MKVLFHGAMVLIATFNNISAILWWSVLLVDKIEYPEKITDLLQVIAKLYHMLASFIGV